MSNRPSATDARFAAGTRSCSISARGASACDGDLRSTSRRKAKCGNSSQPSCINCKYIYSLFAKRESKRINCTARATPSDSSSLSSSNNSDLRRSISSCAAIMTSFALQWRAIKVNRSSAPSREQGNRRGMRRRASYKEDWYIESLVILKPYEVVLQPITLH